MCDTTVGRWWRNIHPSQRLGTDYGESKRWEWEERVAAVGPCQMLVAVDFRASNHPAWLSGCQRAGLHPFMAQQKLCGCTWTTEKEGAFPEQKAGDEKTGGQAQYQAEAW